MAHVLHVPSISGPTCCVNNNIAACQKAQASSGHMTGLAAAFMLPDRGVPGAT